MSCTIEFMDLNISKEIARLEILRHSKFLDGPGSSSGLWMKLFHACVCATKIGCTGGCCGLRNLFICLKVFIYIDCSLDSKLKKFPRNFFLGLQSNRKRVRATVEKFRAMKFSFCFSFWWWRENSFWMFCKTKRVTPSKFVTAIICLVWNVSRIF